MYWPLFCPDPCETALKISPYRLFWTADFISYRPCLWVKWKELLFWGSLIPARNPLGPARPQTWFSIGDLFRGHVFWPLFRQKFAEFRHTYFGKLQNVLRLTEFNIFRAHRCTLIAPLVDRSPLRWPEGWIGVGSWQFMKSSFNPCCLKNSRTDFGYYFTDTVTDAIILFRHKKEKGLVSFRGNDEECGVYSWDLPFTPNQGHDTISKMLI